MPQPRVLIAACNRQLGDHAFHVVGHKYVAAVRLAGCLPLVAPGALSEELEDWLALADGLLLTGSPSNVHPRHFGEQVHDASLPLDEARDAATLALIPRALAAGLPLLAICRGFQELNVALGGSLQQSVHQQPGRADHRAPDEEPPDVAYAARHEVELQPAGLLAALLGGQARIAVNSLHGQGIATLAPGLRIEATAPDGLIEAVSLPGAPFALGVQWHPEWRAATNPVSMAVLQAFGRACVARHQARAT